MYLPLEKRTRPLLALDLRLKPGKNIYMDSIIQFLISNNQSLILVLGAFIALICVIWFFVVYRSIKLDVVNPSTNNIQALKLKDDLSKKNKEIDRLKHRFENQQQKIEELKSNPAGVDTEVVDSLKKEIEDLKGKLSDYEIIEDDLADLSKFKEENAQLIEKLAKYEKGDA